MYFSPLNPAFLRGRFAKTRKALAGVIPTWEKAYVYASSKAKKRSKAQLLARRAVHAVLSTVIAASILVCAVIFIPSIYYMFFPADVLEIEAPEAGTAFGGSFKQPAPAAATDAAIILASPEPTKTPYIPPQDTTLPEGNWISIPRIGVYTKLRDTQDPEEALVHGVWWVPDFGVPGDTEIPMIVAAHRFGWQWWWQSDYWKYNSFYLLPDTQPGDRVEVISDQRKWVYEIYAGEEGEEILDYTADLILYTCKYLQSPVRHFRYARLIDPTTNTQ